MTYSLFRLLWLTFLILACSVDDLFEKVYNWLSWENFGITLIVLIGFSFLVLSKEAIKKSHGQ